MTISSLKDFYKYKVSSIPALIEKRGVAFAILTIFLFLMAFAIYLIFINCFLTSLIFFILIILVLFPWTYVTANELKKKYNGKYGIIINGKITVAQIDKIKSEKIKEYLGEEAIENSEFMNKLKLLLNEEMNLSKKEIDITKWPFISAFSTIVISAITVLYIKNISEEVVIRNLKLVFILYACLLIFYRFIRFFLLGILNSKHNRVKDLLSIINDIELEMAYKKSIQRIK